MKKILTAALVGVTLLTGAALASPQDRTMHRDMLAKADANDDGVISKAEFLADVDARFARLDANGDGKISADERPGSGRGKRMAGRMMKRLDSDGDGAISLAEQRAQAAKRFERLDANHDGTIDSAERESARERMRAMMERRGGGAPESE